jgi:hypothetical protein
MKSKFQIHDCSPLALLNISGSAKIGKSLLANAISEIAGLYDNPLVGKLDIDEKNDRDFQRYHESVLAMPMRDFDDIARISSQLPKGCRLALCDTPGAFQTFASKINEKQDFLLESNITFVPILVTTDQGQAGALIQTWLEIFQHCEKAFVVQNVIKDPCGMAIPPLVLPVGIPQPEEVTVMRMPYLHSPFANEMSRIAARIMQVIDCDIDAEESEILSMSQTRRFVSTWAMRAEEALAPLIGFITRTIQEPSPENGKTASKNSKPSNP